MGCVGELHIDEGVDCRDVGDMGDVDNGGDSGTYFVVGRIGVDGTDWIRSITNGNFGQCCGGSTSKLGETKHGSDGSNSTSEIGESNGISTDGLFSIRNLVLASIC